jgi:putative two-component system response regulator
LTGHHFETYNQQHWSKGFVRTTGAAVSRKPDATRPGRGPTFGQVVGERYSPIRVLATDTLPETLRLVERTLGEEYECELAASVAAAREKLAGPPFQLALCDVQMSGEAGFILLDEIARDHPETAIVMVAGVDKPEIAESAFRLCAQGYLVKPFRPGQLRVAAANALRHHRLETSERARQRALLGGEEEKAEALRHELVDLQRRAIEELRTSQQETVERLTRVFEIHDPESGRHIGRVASIAVLLGIKLGLERRQVMLLRTAAPMHDIGKVTTPDGVLRRRGTLTRSERERMESHTEAGHEILSGSESDLLKMAARIALTHHEWYDGSGYPQGLRGEEIPVEGRIVAVADVFDALLSERPHRPALGVEEATKAICGERGTHFDPEVVDALLDNIEEALSLRG